MSLNERRLEKLVSYIEECGGQAGWSRIFRKFGWGSNAQKYFLDTLQDMGVIKVVMYSNITREQAFEGIEKRMYRLTEVKTE
jgi:hypothetical protein